MSDPRAPSVEMLWETVDPHATLHERFGFPDAASAGVWVTDTVRAGWGIEVLDCRRIVMSDKNALAWLTSSQGPLVAKWSIAPEEFARLEALSHVIEELGRSGIPVPVPPTMRGQPLRVEIDGASMGLQRAVPGRILDVGDPRQVRAAGRMLGRLHATLAQIPDVGEALAPSEPHVSLPERVREWCAADRSSIPESALDVLRDSVIDDHDGLPRHLLHGDFRSTNILWSGHEISGVLDLDDARIDYRIDEVARSAVLLGTRFTDWDPVTAEVRTEFLRGYESVNPLTPVEARWWGVLVLWYSLAMIPASGQSSMWLHAAMDEVSKHHHGKR